MKIKQLREEHPNLGAEKIFPILEKYCKENKLQCPKPRTIARIISADPHKMRTFPQKIYHSGRIKPMKRQKVTRKPST
ncbi:hypothetical protein GYA01_00705 [Patescibacteria group bacterium]|nr:hypothetical protein [Patescibacteria group bacterium]